MKFLFLLCLVVTNQNLSLFAQTFPSKTWEKVKSASYYGWNQNKLNQIESYIADSTASTGVMIIQDGKVIYEYGNNAENSYIASCRKSVLSMLYGKYVDNGVINLNKSLKDLEITYDGTLSPIEQTATIRDIISSRSGIYLPAANEGDMVHLAPKRGTVNPGELWIYNNWDFNMAGYIFEKETKKNIYDEIEVQLALPLQMEDWEKSSQEKSGEVVLTDVMAYHINFSNRDMGRLGLLLLNKGKWAGQQLISENWIDSMTKPTTTFEEVDKIAPFVKNKYTQISYGYMWWIWDNPKNKALINAYSAQGAYGQNITVIPEINTVVVIKTNALYDRQYGDHYYLIDLIASSFNLDQKKDLAQLATSLANNDMKTFTSLYSEMKLDSHSLNHQNLINNLAYYYLRDKKNYEMALLLFKLNTKLFSSSWEVYDGLAEWNYVTGNYTDAKANYEISIRLNKNNDWNYNSRTTFILERLNYKLKTN